MIATCKLQHCTQPHNWCSFILRNNVLVIYQDGDQYGPKENDYIRCKLSTSLALANKVKDGCYAFTLEHTLHGPYVLIFIKDMMMIYEYGTVGNFGHRCE